MQHAARFVPQNQGGQSLAITGGHHNQVAGTRIGSIDNRVVSRSLVATTVSHGTLAASAVFCTNARNLSARRALPLPPDPASTVERASSAIARRKSGMTCIPVISRRTASPARCALNGPFGMFRAVGGHQYVFEHGFLLRL